MEQNVPTRQGVSAALAAAQAKAAIPSSVRFPGEDRGWSLAEMAQRDLDAALQLLADRAQYITGASGAAIALRRDGRADMLCRASSGTNAPELGALLSTEFGLSGESVRTRQLMRCDDAERDARVNREVCRQMGIASVLVMPVVDDDQVLGVFELFSSKANAFGERDLSAVQRLSEMVETAVRMAHATESLPEQLSARESSVAEARHPEVFEGQFLRDLVVEEGKAVEPAKEHRADEAAAKTVPTAPLRSDEATSAAMRTPEVVVSQPQAQVAATSQVKAQAIDGPTAPPKPLFWSAADTQEAEAQKSDEADESHVPPMLRALRKCEACGFPISAGRTLCVECEEKKWRGQLRPQSANRKPPTSAVAIPSVKPGSPLFAAAAPSMAKTIPGAAESTPKAKAVKTSPVATMPAPENVAQRIAPEAEPPEFVLSAGMGPSRSWFSANRYIVLMLLAIAAVAALLILR